MARSESVTFERVTSPKFLLLFSSYLKVTCEGIRLILAIVVYSIIMRLDFFLLTLLVFFDGVGILSF